MNTKQMIEEAAFTAYGASGQTTERVVKVSDVYKLLTKHEAAVLERVKQNTVGKWEDEKISRADFEESLSTADHLRDSK